MAYSTPQFSTIITWLLYFVPVYIFVLDPLLRPYFPDSASLSWGEDQDGHVLEGWDTAPSTLHLTDDSFISPDDGVPVNCPGEAEGYRVHLLSQAPLVLYIENFVSAAEADHLVDIRYVLFPHYPTKQPSRQQPQKQIKPKKQNTKLTHPSIHQSKQIHPLNNLQRQNPTHRSLKTPLRPRPPRPRRHSPLPREPRPLLPRLASAPVHRAHVGPALQCLWPLQASL